MREQIYALPPIGSTTHFTLVAPMPTAADTAGSKAGTEIICTHDRFTEANRLGSLRNQLAA